MATAIVMTRMEIMMMIRIRRKSVKRYDNIVNGSEIL